MHWSGILGGGFGVYSRVGHFWASSASVKHLLTLGSPPAAALGARRSSASSKGVYSSSSNTSRMVPFIGKGPPTDLAVSSDDILFVYHIILFYILCITFQGITVHLLPVDNERQGSE
ncbi:hypothetical protein FR483_n194L [Paramecium bursaria Chlorella virus FR483]|uniref:Uncharacterized protein n194L n=1 Tax=Paramecium bursaria Chlorella virus FR483 TaxID=399781 RepID=A7J6P8_PBCVF|nr:hypothetical protein FR483_n194L [Paramecium bursaria Chlorella virus FR483]ABT15479.1 hypothetical protein FR483_n194L [Paramecium bursaria Chlorella virus FR483]